ncbi:MAG: family CoA transferase [Gammaproteobacteria bacterium]|nr:family CoA transferase [Gammaproteobacteria bacterium]
MTRLSSALTKLCWSAIGGEPGAADEVIFRGSGGLSSPFAVTDVASAAIATAALSVTEFVREAHGVRASIVVDRRMSSLWFAASLRPIGWHPPPWDPIGGDYPTRDGWIRLHTNAPAHRAAAEHVLGTTGDRTAIARAVARWLKRDLEEAVVKAGGCAAEMRSMAEWQQHPQGRAVAAEPLAHLARLDSAAPRHWSFSATRPLQGLRVLDLTRVLAGPVASRFLAGYGAEVLRIDPPDWGEPSIVPEVTLGKRCARLNLQEQGARATFEQLLSSADVLLHGYRPGALDRLGYDAETRRRLSPGLIDVTLDAYGWSGPWATRRGFDSLVQMSTGIADCGMKRASAEKPIPLPVQALDHATGYLMAATAIRGVTGRLTHGNSTTARLSLARTAKLVVDHPSDAEQAPLAQETDSDRSSQIELTDWGNAQRLVPPAQISNAPMQWDFPARNLGSGEPRWSGE